MTREWTDPDPTPPRGIQRPSGNGDGYGSGDGEGYKIINTPTQETPS